MAIGPGIMGQPDTICVAKSLQSCIMVSISYTQCIHTDKYTDTHTYTCNMYREREPEGASQLSLQSA